MLNVMLLWVNSYRFKDWESSDCILSRSCESTRSLLFLYCWQVKFRGMKDVHLQSSARLLCSRESRITLTEDCTERHLSDWRTRRWIRAVTPAFITGLIVKKRKHCGSNLFKKNLCSVWFREFIKKIILTFFIRLSKDYFDFNVSCFSDRLILKPAWNFSENANVC